MSYKMSERDYVSLAMYMSAVLSLQFVIRLGALGTYDTKLLRVVEVVPEYMFSLVFMTSTPSSFVILKLSFVLLLVHFCLSVLSSP